MKKRMILLLFLIGLFKSAHAFTPVRQVQISTGGLTQQGGYYNVFGGTITNIANKDQISTGTFTVNGGTVSWINSVSTGTRFDRSTTTFQGGYFSGVRNDNSTTTFVGSGQAGTVTDTSTRTFQGGTFSGTRNDTSTTTFLGGYSSGVRNDNSTTTFIGGVQQGTKTDIATTTFQGNWTHSGSAINGTTTDNSTTTITGQHFFRNGVNVSTSPGNNTTVFGVFTSSVVITSPLVNIATASNRGVSLQVGASSVSINTPAFILGVTTNQDARAGDYGEYMSSQTVGTTHNFPASGNYGDVVSLTLTPGDWDITLCETSNGGSSNTEVTHGISTTSGNSSSGLVDGVNRISAQAPPVSGSTNQNGCIANYRQIIAASTTFYWKYEATYGGTVPKTGGILSARRRR